MPPPPTCRRCDSPRNELILNAILAGLLTEGRVPPGSIVDAGANDGQWTCYARGIAPERSFHAIDPVHANVQHMKRWLADCPRVTVMRGGLARARARIDAGTHASSIRLGGQIHEAGRLPRLSAAAGTINGSSSSSSETLFDVYALDDLFGVSPATAWTPWQGEQLGLIHLDAEGMDFEILRGAATILKRDGPIVSTELRVHEDANATLAILRFVDSLSYDTFLVEEVCGIPRVDCRNLLLLPRHRRRQLLRSPTLDLATAARHLFKVDEATIFDHAYPCCRSGGECCPNGASHLESCCTKERVGAWLREARRKFAPERNLHTNNNSSVRHLERDPSLLTPPVFFYARAYKFPGPEPGSRMAQQGVW